MKKGQPISPDLRDRHIADWRERRDAGRYQPFIRTERAPSGGNRARVPGIKSGGREHHTLSHNEYLLFCLLEHDEIVRAIWEQYPLLEVDETVAIACELGIRHPRYPGTRTDVCMTTDFLVDLTDGGQRAYAVKSAHALENDRTKQKLSIEEEYWRRRGVPWQALTDVELRIERSENIAFLHSFGRLNLKLAAHSLDWFEAFKAESNKTKDAQLADVVEATAVDLGLTYHESVQIYYYLQWVGRISLQTRPYELDLVVLESGLTFHDQC
ncbi:TnsA endonuclease N-terminal domain-containing protein [Ectothiorhodospiraceae bacterium WFHF3C12]|nr:TnsA endonuclease N-terminal domain-containing protein [Ectothiorhodospiraceae bacterium WFHF3C12]